MEIFIVEKNCFQRKGDPFNHGVEEVCFVGEVPIHGTSRCAGALGNILKAGARYALGLKQVLSWGDASGGLAGA